MSRMGVCCPLLRVEGGEGGGEGGGSRLFSPMQSGPLIASPSPMLGRRMNARKK
jgi:hypothetical protein